MRHQAVRTAWRKEVTSERERSGGPQCDIGAEIVLDKGKSEIDA
jgi:hypothetical protein